MEREIQVRGARTNNLKDISVTIPHGRLTVMTGKAPLPSQPP
jgi:excinuclease UvrABC ATPase subunit